MIVIGEISHQLNVKWSGKERQKVVISSECWNYLELVVLVLFIVYSFILIIWKYLLWLWEITTGCMESAYTQDFVTLFESVILRIEFEKRCETNYGTRTGNFIISLYLLCRHCICDSNTAKLWTSMRFEVRFSKMIWQ